jgi:hypothetical protein
MHGFDSSAPVSPRTPHAIVDQRNTQEHLEQHGNNSSRPTIWFRIQCKRTGMDYWHCEYDVIATCITIQTTVYCTPNHCRCRFPRRIPQCLSSLLGHISDIVLAGVNVIINNSVSHGSKRFPPPLCMLQYCTVEVSVSQGRNNRRPTSRPRLKQILATFGLHSIARRDYSRFGAGRWVARWALIDSMM